MNKPINKLSAEFKINDRVTYLNNAALGPISQTVIRKYHSYIESYATLGPGSLNVKKEEYFEKCRKEVANFLNCKPKEIILTQSVTSGINIVAEGFRFQKGEKIILRESKKEHVANFLPWLKRSREDNIELEITGSDSNGRFNLKELEQTMQENRGGVISIAHALYNLGTILEVKKVSQLAKKYNYHLLVDAAQTAGCLPIDLGKINCDFMALSGYKWLGSPPGIGVLYIRKDVQRRINPWGMDVRALKSKKEGVQVKLMFSENNYTLKEGPYCFENGFRNYSGVVGLLSAIEFINQIGVKNIRQRNMKLIRLAMNKLSKIKSIKIYGPKKAEGRTSIVSFNIKGMRPSDLVSTLNQSNYILAAREIGDEPIIRISPHFYNNQQQITNCVSLIKETIESEKR